MLTAYRVLILAPYALIALLIAIEPSYWPCLLGAVTVFSALKLARDLKQYGRGFTPAAVSTELFLTHPFLMLFLFSADLLKPQGTE